MRTSSIAPGVEADAFGDDLGDDVGGQALQQADALAQRGLELDLAAHGAFGDRGDLLLQAEFGGELVDAFLADHGGIHVGDEQALGAAVGLLHHDVDRRVEGDAQFLGDRLLVAGVGGEADVGGDAGRQPVDRRAGEPFARRLGELVVSGPARSETRSGLQHGS